jgi:serine/threonine protein kinase
MLVGGKFQVQSFLASGGFGSIFKGVNIETGEEVALKTEPAGAPHPQVVYEAKLYRALGAEPGIPNLHWAGVDGESNVLVVDLLGSSLQSLMDSCGNTLSLKTVLKLGDQMISRLEFLHACNFLHRDVKPENFCMGLGSKARMVHLLDFGLAKKFREKNMKHISYREGKKVVGSLRYASRSAHLGFEQGRRDDLESLGYVLVYLLKGTLPWQILEKTTVCKNTKNKDICRCKMATPAQELCKELPSEFATYFEVCRELRFEEKPDYTRLQDLFRTVMAREGYRRDFVYDWDDSATLTGAQTRGVMSNVARYSGSSSEDIDSELTTVPSQASRSTHHSKAKHKADDAEPTRKVALKEIIEHTCVPTSAEKTC